MSITAFVILDGGDDPESLGRVVNAFMGALKYVEADGEIHIIFDGAGTQAAAAFADPEHKYHELYQRIRAKITGACSYCANAYEGEVFDCDFNQMLRMQQRAEGKPLFLWDITPESMASQPILTANHCLGCTAGHGISCTGALEEPATHKVLLTC